MNTNERQLKVGQASCLSLLALPRDDRQAESLSYVEEC